MNAIANRLKIRMTPGIALRVAADAALVMAALLAGLVVRLLILIVFEKPDDITSFYYVQRDAISFAQVFAPLTIIALVTFWLNGFYTYGKNYISRFKPIVVAQAVTLAFLVFGFASYLIFREVPISRGAYYLAWFFAVLFIVGARVWTDLWKGYVDPERQRIMKANAEQDRILVIGGAGYIGSALVPLLLEEGHRVRVLDILMFGDEPLKRVIDHPKLEIVQGDFRNVVTLFRAMQDVGSVVHLGAIVGDPACQHDEELTIDVNLVSTQVIAELAEHAGVQRFVFASTCSVYGASDELLDERSPVRPISLYGHTKLASERVLLEEAGGGFAPTVLRFATIYGFSGRTRFDLVVNLLTAKARLEGEITIHGGNQWRPFVHVEDAARSIVATLAAPIHVVGGEIFNVGSDDQNHTILEIGEMIRDRVIDSKLSVCESATDNRNYRVSFRRVADRLGFSPKWSIEDGIQQVLEAIAAGDVTDYRDERYSNEKFLTSQGASMLVQDQWARDMINDVASE
jgi:nucleoside-diphosphate-sugar epimerase